MKNILLTSCGLETETIKNTFLKMLTKEAKSINALFIPTAAIYPDAINVLPKCLNDLLKCGVRKENIDVYDLHTFRSTDNYDVMYLCGGDPRYLLDRINEIGFNYEIRKFINRGGTVLGVSAGSMIFAGNMTNNLNILPYSLAVHCSQDICEKPGLYTNINNKNGIYLGNKQAIIFNDGNQIEIIE